MRQERVRAGDGGGAGGGREALGRRQRGGGAPERRDERRVARHARAQLLVCVRTCVRVRARLLRPGRRLLGNDTVTIVSSKLTRSVRPD